MTLAADIPVMGPLLGGALIGLAVVMMLIVNGSVTGISGIVGNTLKLELGPSAWRPMFVVGLLLSIPVVFLFQGEMPPYLIEADTTMLAVAGLLVGVGTRIGNGCTSGHGVCGIANLSPRSIVATLVFMATAALVVYFVRHGGV
ncbi:MAG: YeeE/YedE thiosulfate transporter family protein [Salinisphaeraceae bacterium]|nr:YeeE/YedE thiosulfate transporter family protein [Salinisphaeraceae bacterium]